MTAGDGPDRPDRAGPVPDQGPDAAREALARARAAAEARGLRPVRRPRKKYRPGLAVDTSHDDGRDPKPVRGVIDRVVAELGWSTELAVGGVAGRWEQIVGDEVAAHCEPQHFAEGKLTVRCDSTSWAAQMRLFVPTLLRRLTEELGDGVVEQIVVRGPAAPSWRKGPRRVDGGRGPRDTYG